MRERDRVLDRVGEFAHVARPTIPAQSGLHRGGERGRPPPRGVACILQKVVGQQHHVVETITQRDLNGVLAEEIFEPLGMRNSIFLWAQGETRRVANGHEKDTTPAAEKLVEEMNAACSLHSTAPDCLKFVDFVVTQPEAAELSLEGRLYREMLTPQVPVNDSISWQNDWPRYTIAVHETV